MYTIQSMVGAILRHSVLAIIIGVVVALFLWSLDQITELFWAFPLLLFALPLFGILSAWCYRLAGASADQGNALIIQEAREPKGDVPLRMAPLVFLGTLLTHLGGGSAGREGTAVQIGGSIGATVARWFGTSNAEATSLLQSGVAAGFGAVFGTPIAGVVFAIEFLRYRKLYYENLVPCLFSAIVADQVTLLCGIRHTPYTVDLSSYQQYQGSLSALVLVWWVAVAAVVFGLAARLFVELTYFISHRFKRVKRDWLRPCFGGMLVVAIVFCLQGYSYTGLGVNPNPNLTECVTIQSSFKLHGVEWYSWLFKLILTAITVGSGFKGGEATPLFFIGASLGNVFAELTGNPVDLFAALGFVSLFAAATKTPLACVVMGIELFGPFSQELFSIPMVTYLAIACCLSCTVSGKRGVYSASHTQKSG